VSSLYKPYPGYHLPVNDHDHDESHPPTMAFGISSMVEGKDQDGSIGRRVAGRAPDLCLAVGKRVEKGEAKVAGAGAARRLIPVK
jgi:hypothetical protein